MRAKNMQSFTNDVKAEYPGVTVYGIGDDPHKKRISDHNEDDTSGVRTPQTDSDNIKEHRAVDLMIGSKFTKSDADGLVSRLLADKKALARLTHIIWNGKEWSRSKNWQTVKRTEDRHEDHVHVAGHAADDDNTAPWPAVKSGTKPKPPAPKPSLDVDGELGPKTIARWQQVMGTTVDGKIDEKDSQLIRKVQTRLKGTVNNHLVVDGELGFKTIVALQKYLGCPTDGFISKPSSPTIKALQRRLNANRF